MQAAQQYAQRTLDAQAERFATVVEGLTPEALAWRPGDETTNSIAQIVRHVVAWQPWYFGVALSDPVPLDDAALETKQTDSLGNGPTSTEALRTLITESRTQTAAALARLTDLDLNETITPYGDPEARGDYLSGAIDHAAEHIGHAELTRQLWEQRL